ncbi:MAG: FAD-binding oxidoreductase [Candidatus Poseidoniia archaeon]|nr:FAD-binding oxidoreductase [Candidatus Poseidoniia archaeon]
MTESLFTENYKNTPYWWDRTPRPTIKEISLPKETEVLVIGSGYTGLCTAIQTCRNGLDTVVLDAQDAGWGGSSRNGGQVSPNIKPSFQELSRKYGEEPARALLKEGNDALKWIGDFIQKENIDCDFRRVGRYYGAHSFSQFKHLEKKINEQPDGLQLDVNLIPKSQQHTEIGSDFYHGGIVHKNHASLDPARFHQGLLEGALTSGAQIKTHCAVNKIEKKGGIFQIHTEAGTMSAREVVVATSGYTGTATPWHRRRVIPIGSYIISTELLAEDLVNELIPRDRVITDSRKLVVYYRASPDRKRILFGGRVSLNETDPDKCAKPLHKKLTQIFPQLAKIKVSHSWMGFVGFTFDHMPHTGDKEGVHYAMGYCGSGVCLSSYFGTKLGQRLAGLSQGNTVFTDITFQTRPFYKGNPWFLAPSILYFQFRDRFLS